MRFLGCSKSSHQLFLKAALKNFAVFTGKHLCWSLFLIKFIYQKESPTQMFFCEYCKIFKNTYFEEHLQTDASVAQVK